MAGLRTTAFVDALRRAEDAMDPEPLVALFGDRSALENAARGVARSGPDGARRFWRDYLAAFGRVRSEFSRVLEGPSSATLEWESAGTLAATGEAIRYRGASVLEFDGDRVARFATYYDSAAFLPTGSKHA